MQTAVVVLVSGLVALFGVASAVLGFKAEDNRLTPDEISVFGRECMYPANPANTLGTCAIYLLAAAQIITSAAGVGSCCRRPPPPGGASSNSNSWRRVLGAFAFVLSWVAAVIAAVYYRVGVKWNTPTTREAKIDIVGAVEECYVLEGGVFARAAILSLIATAFGITSCVLLRLPTATEVPVEGQHAVGLPEWQEPNPKLAPPSTQGQAHARVQVVSYLARCDVASKK